MISRRHERSDAERVEHLLVTLFAPDDDEVRGDEETREEEAEAAGIDFEGWAAKIRAKARARLDAERRAEAERLEEERLEEEAGRAGV